MRRIRRAPAARNCAERAAVGGVGQRVSKVGGQLHQSVPPPRLAHDPADGHRSAVEQDHRHGAIRRDHEVLDQLARHIALWQSEIDHASTHDDRLGLGGLDVHRA